MTPEELNSTIDFIIQSQARLAAAQEQDREDRVRFEEWSKNLFTQLAAADVRIANLLELQSRRLDRAERAEREAQKRHEEAQRRYDELFREVCLRLDRILGKPPRESN